MADCLISYILLILMKQEMMYMSSLNALFGNPKTQMKIRYLGTKCFILGKLVKGVCGYVSLGIKLF